MALDAPRQDQPPVLQAALADINIRKAGQGF